MGDVLHALPAVTALRDAHPECEIGWAIDPRWTPLLRAAPQPDAEPTTPGMPLVNHIHIANTRQWKAAPLSIDTLRSITSLRRDLRSANYDLCIDLQGSIRSALIGRMAGAKNFAGNTRPRESPARWLYRQRVTTHQAHVVDQACEIIAEAVGETIRPAIPLLPIDPEAEAWSTALLGELQRQTGATSFAIISPGAGWGAKRWPAESFGEVATGLAAAGHLVLINAGPAEDGLASQVIRAASRSSSGVDGAQGRFNRASSGNPLIHAVPCGIGQLASLLRRASLFVGGDTGPLHLAAALQCPVVGIYGPTDPARNGPYQGPYSNPDSKHGNLRNIVLRGAGSVTDHSRVSAPGGALLSTTPRQVLDAVFMLLSASAAVVVSPRMNVERQPSDPMDHMNVPGHGGPESDCGAKEEGPR